jgi:MarR family transcriptional regulator for hemolysin
MDADMPSTSETVLSFFGALIAQTARHWRRAVDRGLQPYGLTEATWLPLIRLARAPEAMRQKELAASLSLDGSAVVRLLDSLEAAGLILRREEDADRRAKAIILTEPGRRMVDRVEAAAREVREDALAGLTQDEIEIAARVLARICSRLAAIQGNAAP